MKWNLRFRNSAPSRKVAWIAWPLGIAASVAFVIPSRDSRTVTEAQAAVLENCHYIRIEKEDTLSQALDKLFPNRTWRIWGTKGALVRIAELNPTIPNLHRVFPGMLINIGEYAADLPPGYPVLSSAETVQQREPASVSQAEMTAVQDSSLAPVAMPSPEASASVSVFVPEPLPHPSVTSVAPVAPVVSVVRTETPVIAQQAPLPAPSLAPAPAPVAEPSPQASDRHGGLWIASEFSYSRINAMDRSTGGTASYLSTLSPGFRFSWIQHWSDRLQTALNFGARNETYIAPAGITLQNSSQILADFGPSAKWVPFEGLPQLALDGRFEVRQEIFVRATSLTATSLDALMVPQAMAGVRYRVLRLAPFSLILNAHGLMLFGTSSGSYTVQSGSGYALGGTLIQDLSKNVQLSGKMWYFYQSQGTSIADQNRVDVGISLGVSIRLESDPKLEELNRRDLP